MLHTLLLGMTIYVLLICLRNVFAWPIGLALQLFGVPNSVDIARNLIALISQCCCLVVCGFGMYLVMPTIWPVFSAIAMAFFSAVRLIGTLVLSSV